MNYPFVFCYFKYCKNPFSVALCMNFLEHVFWFTTIHLTALYAMHRTLYEREISYQTNSLQSNAAWVLWPSRIQFDISAPRRCSTLGVVFYCRRHWLLCLLLKHGDTTECETGVTLLSGAFLPVFPSPWPRTLAQPSAHSLSFFFPKVKGVIC